LIGVGCDFPCELVIKSAAHVFLCDIRTILFSVDCCCMIWLGRVLVHVIIIESGHMNCFFFGEMNLTVA